MRGQEVHVRAGEEDLGIGIVDEVTSGADAVWIFFPGAAPRRLPTDHGSIEFTVLESEPGPRSTAMVPPAKLALELKGTPLSVWRAGPH